ncbi:MAG: hypothetical protein Kow0092_19540 [Deferrisomatales bacterium]
MGRVRGVDLLRAFGRSLWLQAAWSFRGMQAVGFAYAVDPVLARLYGEGDDRQRARSRHLELFNTHPFLASAILGCVIRLEERGEPGADEAVRRVKAALMGPCGAVGDSLYWSGLKPLLLLAALHAAYLGHGWAPWAFVGSFLGMNVAGRVLGFWQGYRKGVAVIDTVGRLDLLAWSRRGKALGAVLLGSLLTLAAAPTALDRWEVPAALWVPGAWAVALGLSWVVDRGVRPEWLVYLAALVSGVVVTCT